MHRLQNISIDLKTVALFAGGFVLGNIYGTITTMKMSRQGVTFVKGYIVK